MTRKWKGPSRGLSPDGTGGGASVLDQPVLIRRRFNRETEVDLRIEFMQVCNHPRRQLAPDASRPAVTATERANLQMLASLLDLLNPEERLILAEVRRQLGEFDRAAVALGWAWKRGNGR